MIDRQVSYGRLRDAQAVAAQWKKFRIGNDLSLDDKKKIMVLFDYYVDYIPLWSDASNKEYLNSPLVSKVFKMMKELKKHEM